MADEDPIDLDAFIASAQRALREELQETKRHARRAVGAGTATLLGAASRPLVSAVEGLFDMLDDVMDGAVKPKDDGDER